MFHSDNVYRIPHIRVKGQVCYTNFPSNTAFRGFGGPQGMLIAENWVQKVAMELQKSPEEIRVSFPYRGWLWIVDIVTFIFMLLSFSFSIGGLVTRKSTFMMKDMCCTMGSNFNTVHWGSYGMNWSLPVISQRPAKRSATLTCTTAGESVESRWFQLNLVYRLQQNTWTRWVGNWVDV